jgi:hypothetical protein
MRRAALVLAVLGLSLTVPAAAQPERGCTAVTKRQPGARNVGFRLKCGFSIDSVSIRTSRTFSRLARRPRIDSRRVRDRLTCGQRSKRSARCEGDLSVRARVIGAFAVRGDPCDGLRTTFDVSGGACTDDVICIQIAYAAKVRVKQPRGC